MNPEEEQELQKLEQHLRQLLPAEPGEALTARIFDAFDTPSDAAPAAVGNITPLPTKARASWAQPFAAAAAVVLIAGIVALVGLSRPSDQGKAAEVRPGIVIAAQPARFVPSRAQNSYQGSQVDGLIFTEDRRPMQAVRHQFIETYIWENPADGSRVEVRVPVERIRYVPVPTD
jgi:hypothetical protein